MARVRSTVLPFIQAICFLLFQNTLTAAFVLVFMYVADSSFKKKSGSKVSQTSASTSGRRASGGSTAAASTKAATNMGATSATTATEAPTQGGTVANTEDVTTTATQV